jgi:ArsR family transcriptional regulator, arsenate/arsenite/antimonite-responsive transcriptional repressor
MPDATRIGARTTERSAAMATRSTSRSVRAGARDADARDTHAPCAVPPPAPDTVTIPDDDALAAMAKALGHPARLAILRLLAHRDTCATGDVVAQLPLAQSTVSEHLRILREAGLVQGEFDGPRSFYCVNPAGLAALRAGIAAL